MGTTIVYTNTSEGTAVVALDAATVANDTSNGTVTFSQATPVATTEAQLLNAASAVSTSALIDTNRSNQVVDYDLPDANASADTEQEDGTSEPESVFVVEFPPSYNSELKMPRWSRICWEQQKAVYNGARWWWNIPGLDSSTPQEVEEGENIIWPQNTFEFPIVSDYYVLGTTGKGSVPTKPIISPVFGRNEKAITVENTNDTIEDIQVVFRRTPEGLTAVGGTPTEAGPWIDWRLMDAGDMAENWRPTGTWDIDTHRS